MAEPDRQPDEHAPGIGAERAAALQGEIDLLDLAGRHKRIGGLTRAVRGIGWDAQAVQRTQGFIEENVTGHSTHGSSKKQKDAVEARHASFAFGAFDSRAIDRCKERRDSFSASHFA